MKKILSSISFLFLFTTQILAEPLITKKLIVKAEKKYGQFARNRFVAIDKKLIKQLKSQPPLKQLKAVNDWFNYMKFSSDQKIYGKSDYWATLYEFTGKGMGDCEDFTIAKYYTLKEIGFDLRRLKFTYVVYKNRAGKNISHMVLSYLKIAKPRTKNDILLLDNINKRILPASKRKDIVKMIKMINGDTGAKSKRWKKMEADMKRKKL
jgi:predicted transglutaminase-like cysteine proteinase